MLRFFTVFFSVQLDDYPDETTVNGSSQALVCILYSSQDNGRFEYGHSRACDAEIYGFAFMAGIFVIFIVVSVGRVVTAAE